MQTRLESLLEQLLNIGSGFIIASMLWEFVVKPVWGFGTSFGQNLQITSLFTVVSIARGYVWRRLWNHISIQKQQQGDSLGKVTHWFGWCRWRRQGHNR